MDIIITLTSVGSDQGTLFDIYSDTDGFTTAFDTDVPVASLQAGYTAAAPDGTLVVRVCGQEPSCVNCIDITPTYTTTTSTTLAGVECEETVNAGGSGVTEYQIQLDPVGGLLVFDFNAYGVPDKLEIIHNGSKVATTGMTVANAGPFDDLYGDPTVPTQPQTLLVDQFIGTQKAIPPNREAEILADTGQAFTSTGQQLVWFEYTEKEYGDDAYAYVRITGPSGTAWQLERLCSPVTTTTTSTSSTTTTTTTATPTTTTTTTLTGLDEATISDTTSLIADCGLTLVDTVYIDTATPGTLSVDDVIYTNSSGTTLFNGNGDYYHIDLDGAGTEFTARVSFTGKVLSPVVAC